jgi:hypothetical protein
MRPFAGQLGAGMELAALVLAILICGIIVWTRLSPEERKRRIDNFDDAW